MFPNLIKFVKTNYLTTNIRFWHDRSQVPRIADDRRKRTTKLTDTGYFYRYHRPGVDPLPRIPNLKEPLFKPKDKFKDHWTESNARFGENDYIDILGDGSLHPSQLLYHVPRWLRGFPGNHRANELIRKIHYRNVYGPKIQQTSPHSFHQLNKRINYLLEYHNYHKQDELSNERELGLWKREPDYFFKDKQRRSYKDMV
uniref:Large ribosomal subunit protein mL51 n=1 Tax=Meloidogyne floridensis TaxID=298350 RepID=A0A915P2X1_9BILA